jgi:hypothetical protein
MAHPGKTNFPRTQTSGFDLQSEIENPKITMRMGSKIGGVHPCQHIAREFTFAPIKVVSQHGSWIFRFGGIDKNSSRNTATGGLTPETRSMWTMHCC